MLFPQGWIIMQIYNQGTNNYQAFNQEFILFLPTFIYNMT